MADTKKKSKKSFVNLESTKDRPDGIYSSVIAKIQQDGVCPFCKDQLTKYHKNPILLEGKYWLITENMYPYKGTQHHFLLIHKRHVNHMKDLSTKAWTELEKISNQVFKDYHVEGGSFLMRFGDTRYTGASVTHLHAHIIIADPDPSRDPVLARVG
jgi:diadenosine tetraphosphate (Ap4A) HIT family hydrolase